MKDYIPTGKSMLKWLKANVPNFNPDIFLVQSKGPSSHVPAVIVQGGKLVEVGLPTKIEKLVQWIPRFEEYFRGERFTDKDYYSLEVDGVFIDCFEADWKERNQICNKFYEKLGITTKYSDWRRVKMTEIERPKTWKTIADV